MTDKSKQTYSSEADRVETARWLAALPEACLLLDDRWTIVGANEQADELLGAAIEIEKPFEELSVVFESPKPATIPAQGWESKGKLGEREFIFRFRVLDGDSKFKLCFIAPIENGRDQSELIRRLQKTVEIRTRLFKHTEEKYKHLFEKSSFGIAQLDPNGDWITANPTFREIAERDEREILGIRFVDLIHRDDRDAFEKKRADWLERDSRDMLKSRLCAPDGKEKQIVIWSQRLLNENAVFGVQLSVMDVTKDTNERLEAEAERNRIKESLENVLKSMVEALLVVEPNGIIAQVNPAMEEMVGWKGSELIGKPIGKLFAGAEDDIAAETRRFGKLLKASTVREVEMAWSRRDGCIVPVSFNASIMRNSVGKLVGIVGVARDLRENRIKKKLEETNKELEKAFANLKKLDEAKDGLISMVGHELRSPLASARGFAELILDKRTSEDDRLRFADRIVSEMDRLARLVNDILDLAKLEAGKLKYRMEPTSIKEIIRSCVNRAEPLASERKIKFNPSFENCPAVVADVDRMAQVVDNLFSNAIKFSPENGEIEVAVTDHKHFVKIAVRDHGVGIPEDHASAVFDKFEQTPEGQRRRVSTGLGMPIAKLIVEEGHHGRIWFESEGEGKGTTFFVTVPKNLQSAAT